MNSDEHRPVNWFVSGRYPSCSCGLDPRDNGVLNRHWESVGFKWVDDHGQLVAK